MQEAVFGRIFLVTCGVRSSYMDYKTYTTRYPIRTVSRKSARCIVSTDAYVSYKAYTGIYPIKTPITRWFVGGTVLEK